MDSIENRKLRHAIELFIIIIIIIIIKIIFSVILSKGGCVCEGWWERSLSEKNAWQLRYLQTTTWVEGTLLEGPSRLSA